MQNYNMQMNEAVNVDEISVLINQLGAVFEHVVGLLGRDGPIRYMIATTLRMLIAMMINIQPRVFEQDKQ